ncbi:uncharacterized protein LOC127255798 isoform X2 [Andrographis paniculata]|uniref:uncharacterized protein LOC127255798 isoform X2 n=1 Tax=Andrographis paniculata TaxID=175694 RepID=UPI0021E7369E|nr:uncharacterized protein LOC127255798 isoform X2 [Andrographis paniculata]
MGAACCVAAKDRTIVSRSPGETLQRHTRYSPTWSFRWDNRGRVAGEETSVNWLHDRGGGNSHIEVKSGTTVDTAFASQESSPLNAPQSPAVSKLPPSVGNGQPVLQNIMEVCKEDDYNRFDLLEVKEPIDAPSVSCPYPVKLSPSAPSMSASPPNSTPSRWLRRSSGQQLLRQGSDAARNPKPKPPSPTLSISEEPPVFLPPAWGNDTSMGSNGGSSDNWSIPTFHELVTTRKERWSFDSEASGFSRDKIAGHSPASASFDLQTCGICTKLLTERSVWGCTSQKIISANEVAVVAVLTCAHVYHGECLECLTPEIHKYDPPCPVCTYGEKRTVKMAEKALKSEMDSKAKKRSRRRVVDDDLNTGMFDHFKGRGDGRSSKSTSSSGTKGKPFLRRHFSFSSKTSRSSSMSENNQSPFKKGFLWSRSIKY